MRAVSCRIAIRGGEGRTSDGINRTDFWRSGLGGSDRERRAPRNRSRERQAQQSRIPHRERYRSVRAHRRFAPRDPGRLIINVTGSLLLGFLVRVALDTPAVTLPMRAFLTTGICGGYTTFSTFSYETAGLIDERAYGKAAIYAGASVALAIVGTFAGFAAARWALGVVRAR